jgi:hypothetical protein
MIKPDGPQVKFLLLMSIYSGFATRQQEGFYNKLIEKCFQLMSSRLIAFFKGDQAQDDLKWAR